MNPSGSELRGQTDETDRPRPVSGFICLIHMLAMKVVEVDSSQRKLIPLVQEIVGGRVRRKWPRR